MKELFKFLVVVSLSLGMGFLLGKKAPSRVLFDKTIAYQNLRDSSYHKCESVGLQMKRNGMIEETFTCSKIKQKLYLTRQFAIVNAGIEK